MSFKELNKELKLEYIETITKKFSDDLKVGSGGYGDVYKGSHNGKHIAVKRLRHLQGIDNKEFQNEFRNLINVQHKNVVKLEGFCHESKTKYYEIDGEGIFGKEEVRILCFEFVPGGALDKHIQEDSCDLDWPTCYKIIRGTCEGINHLQTEYPRPISHLDLKPANILLDDDNNAKIADLGLSRITTQTLVTKNVKGTQGYMPPEFEISGYISKKYDVFSLGVVILNIMDGTGGLARYRQMGPEQFVNHVYRKWLTRFKEKPGHPSHKIESIQVKKCIVLAMKCVQYDYEKRPSTKDIVDELEQLDEEIKKLSLPSDHDQIGQVVDDPELIPSIEHLSSQIISPDQLRLINSVSGPEQLVVVILYAFDCSISTTAWRTVDDGIYWMVQQKLSHYLESCMGYIYFMLKNNTYTSDMKLVDRHENKETGYKSFARRRVSCTENMACGLEEAHNMIENRDSPNAFILLFSDGLIHKGDFFDGAEKFESKFPVHTFTLGGAEYNEGLRAIAANSPGGKFHSTPVPERPMLSTRFSLLLDNIFNGRTIEDKEYPSPNSATQPIDVVLVYAFDCTESTLAWTKMDHSIYWIVQERLTRKEDSCLGYIYPMLTPNNYTSDMKVVDRQESKATGYKSFDWRRLPCTKNMASGLAEAHKMLRNRGNQNGIILFFSDGLINKGDFFDGTETFESEFPVHTFTLAGNAYNQGLQAIANKSPGGMFHSNPVPDRPELSARFSKILDSILGTNKTN